MVEIATTSPIKAAQTDVAAATTTTTVTTHLEARAITIPTTLLDRTARRILLEGIVVRIATLALDRLTRASHKAETVAATITGTRVATLRTAINTGQLAPKKTFRRIAKGRRVKTAVRLRTIIRAAITTPQVEILHLDPTTSLRHTTSLATRIIALLVVRIPPVANPIIIHRQTTIRQATLQVVAIHMVATTRLITAAKGGQTAMTTRKEEEAGEICLGRSEPGCLTDQQGITNSW